MDARFISWFWSIFTITQQCQHTGRAWQWDVRVCQKSILRRGRRRGPWGRFVLHPADVRGGGSSCRWRGLNPVRLRFTNTSTTVRYAAQVAAEFKKKSTVFENYSFERVRMKIKGYRNGPTHQFLARILLLGLRKAVEHVRVEGVMLGSHHGQTIAIYLLLLEE